MNLDVGEFSLEQRWRPGHRGFLVITNSLIPVLDIAKSRLGAQDHDALVEDLACITVLLDAATAMMRFTADFPPEIYRDTIRPTMAPPAMAPGFSGTLMTSHAEMLTSFGKLEGAIRPELSNLPDKVGHAWRRVVKARSRNLAVHGLVCSRFVPGGDSLLKKHLRSKGDLRP